MQRFTGGDRVRVDISDKGDPDHERCHGTYGTVVDVRRDDAGVETGDERDNIEYRVESGEDSMWFRWRDLRPVPSEPP
jgi:ribosomal protein L21E